jgi:hypothetical protein
MSYLFEDESKKANRIEDKIDELIKKCRGFESDNNQLKNVVASQGVHLSALMMLFDKNNVFDMDDFDAAVRVIKEHKIEQANG